MRTRGKTIIGVAAAALLLLSGAITPVQAAETVTDDIKPRSTYHLPTPTDVLDVELSNDGKTAYLATHEGGIDIIDTVSGERTGRIDMPRVGNTALSPDGSVLVASFWAAQGGGQVHVISTATNKIVRTARIADGGGVMAFGPGGVGVYMVGDKVKLLNTRTGTVRTLTTFPQFAIDSICDVLPTADGRRLYAIDCAWMDGKLTLWAINAKTGAIGKRVDLRNPTTSVVSPGAAFSRNGKALYIPAGDIGGGQGRILVYGIPDAKLARTIEVGTFAAPGGFGAAGDGRSLYVGGMPFGGVARMVASSGALTDYHELTGSISDLRLSADRSTIMVHGAKTDEYVMHFLDTGE